MSPLKIAPLLCLALAIISSAEDVLLDPVKAAKTMVVPEGFSVTLFAAEPQVRQPVSFCIDDRGRLWVAEAYNYPDRDRPARDRVIILEDTDGDSQADKQTVFCDKLNYVTGIEVGFGGVWIMSPPSLLFIPDRNGDDQPDAEPEVLLDGFGNRPSAHNIVNGFTWGPDGWLYAGHGRTSPSEVGKPGTTEGDRIHFDGGVFRYHPTRHIFEGFADGTTNPWGVDFDDYGQAFISNCVNPHLYHAIQGAHFEPWRGRKSSEFAFQRLPTIADHVHWLTNTWGASRKGTSPELLAAGGGHAHCGVLVYLGDNWPDRYRNTVLMCNVHGRRINNDSLKRQGSSYSASHGADLLISQDPWFKGVTLRSDPDGAVYVSDWSDTGECHNYKNTQRDTGRIYKITYGKVAPAKIDVAKLDNDQLVQLQLRRNDWHVRHARRVLQERAAAGADLSAAAKGLREIFDNQSDVTRQLRALWALHVIGAADEEFLRKQLDQTDPYLRAWAIRLLSDREDWSLGALTKFESMAREEASAFVRLHLASALQRLPLSARWNIAESLALRAEDSDDPHLPLMYWYAIEPLVPADTPRALRLSKQTKIPLLRQFIARRAALGTN